MQHPNSVALLSAIYAFTLAAAGGVPRGVGPEFVSHYEGKEEFSCITNAAIKLSLDRINDNTCDCPDGSDEPGTAACANIDPLSPEQPLAGSLSGTTNTTNALPGFWCENKGHIGMYVPFLYVNDGVCDYELCCDGSEEYAGVGGLKCENKCAEIGKEYRRLEDEKKKAMSNAAKKRGSMANEAKDLRQKVENKVADLKKEITALEAKMSKSSGRSNPWGRSFKVKWLRLCDLPFQMTLHLKNPLNDFKPVKISRDCQELSTDIGEALCKLFDGEDVKRKLKRIGSSMDDGLSKKSCRNSPVHFDGEDSVPPEPSLHIRWPGSTLLHPSLLYQHVQHDESIYHAMLGRSPRLSFHRNSYSYLDSDNSLCMSQPVLHKSLSNRAGRNEFLQSTKNDTHHEENFHLSLSEDDFLSMTYEEYLQAIGRSSFSSRCLPSASASVGNTSDRAGVADK